MPVFCSILFLALLAVRPVIASQECSFRYEGHLLWVDVQAERCQRTLHFLLDTGATVSVLDAATSKELGIPKGRSVSVAGVGASVTGFWPSHLKAHAGEIALPSKYLVLNLSNLSAACGSHIDGLIGAELFRNNAFEIDFQQRVFRTAPEQRPGNEVILPLKKGPKASLLTLIRVDGRPGWVRLDTGFAGTLDWVTGQSQPNSSDYRVSVGLAEMRTAVRNVRLEMGKTLSLDSVPAGLHSEPVFPGEAGLLGNKVLSGFIVRIDLNRAELGLRKTSPQTPN